MRTLTQQDENSHPLRWEFSPAKVVKVRTLICQSELSLSVRKMISASPPFPQPARPPFCAARPKVHDFSFGNTALQPARPAGPPISVIRWHETTSRFLSKSDHYPGGTNSCILKQPLRCRCKQLLSKSTPYAGGTNSCFLNQLLRWWYISTLEAQPYAGGTDAAKPIHSLQSIR